MFTGVSRKDVEFEALGSLTNMSYKVTTGETAYVLRLPGDDTWEYIDRRAEEHNSGIAATAGIGAEVLYFDTRSGTMVSRFVEGAVLDGAGLARDAEALTRVARIIRRVHGLGRLFRFRFDVFSMILRCRDLLRRLRGRLPEGYDRLERRAGQARRALEASPVPLAACHNDPWPHNFIDTGEGIRLIDWEFSGMNDPFWDLAHLSAEAGFGPEQDQTLVEAYFGVATPQRFFARLELYKAMGDLLWSLWGFIQHANDNPADDFLAYARGRFARCEGRMSSPEFGRHLEVVGEGHRMWTVRTAGLREGYLTSPSVRRANRR
ncbi:MAG: phosphotransferase [Rubrobacteraceae bacterium]